MARDNATARQPELLRPNLRSTIIAIVATEQGRVYLFI